MKIISYDKIRFGNFIEADKVYGKDSVVQNRFLEFKGKKTFVKNTSNRDNAPTRSTD